ncbi:MAG TPA: Panacea domain-containing protein [Mucilaginibacter sp.]
MVNFVVDKDKAINSALYVLDHIGPADYHKVFKILYFAEQYHLKNYGRPLTGDAYQAMNYGPVPSFLYDVFKASDKSSSPFNEALEKSKYFRVLWEGHKPIVNCKSKFDQDELSESDIEALNISISENRSLDFIQLVKKSHDSAWIKVEKNEDIEMSYLDIAEAAGTSSEMLSYICLQAENASSKLI